MTKKQEWRPTRGGNLIGYRPQFLNPEGGWQEVPIERSARKKDGVPYPRCEGGVLESIGLYGNAQAWALAWGFSAGADEIGRTIEVRLQKYEVVYDIKAKVINE